MGTDRKSVLSRWEKDVESKLVITPPLMQGATTFKGEPLSRHFRRSVLVIHEEKTLRILAIEGETFPNFLLKSFEALHIKKPSDDHIESTASRDVTMIEDKSITTYNRLCQKYIKFLKKQCDWVNKDQLIYSLLHQYCLKKQIHQPSLSADGIIIRWVHMTKIDEMCYINEHTVVMSRGSHFNFVNPYNGYKRSYKLTCPYEGDKISCFCTDSSKSLIAYSGVQSYQIIVMEYPHFNKVAFLDDGFKEDYLSLSLGGCDMIYALKSFPSYRISIWNYKTAQLLFTMGHAITSNLSFVRASLNDPSCYVVCTNITSKIARYSVHAFGRMVTVDRREIDTKPGKKICDACYSTPNNNVYFVDELGDVYGVNNKSKLFKLVRWKLKICEIDALDYPPKPQWKTFVFWYRNGLLVLGPSGYLRHFKMSAGKKKKRRFMCSWEVKKECNRMVLSVSDSSSSAAVFCEKRGLCYLKKNVLVSPKDCSHFGVEHMSFLNPDCKYLVTSRKDDIFVWCTKTGQLIHSFYVKINVGSIYSHPNFPYIVITSCDTGSIRVIDLRFIKKPAQLFDMWVSEELIPMIRFSPDGRFMVVLSPESRILVFRADPRVFTFVEAYDLLCKVKSMLIFRMPPSCETRIFTLDHPREPHKEMSHFTLYTLPLYYDGQVFYPEVYEEMEQFYYPEHSFMALTEKRRQIHKLLLEWSEEKLSFTKLAVVDVVQLVSCVPTILSLPYHFLFWGEDGLIYFFSDNTLKTFSVVSNHHRFDNGTKQVILDKRCRYFVSLGKDGVVGCYRFPRKICGHVGHSVPPKPNYIPLPYRRVKEFIPEYELGVLPFDVWFSEMKRYKENKVIRTELANLVHDLMDLKNMYKILFHINESQEDEEARLDHIEFCINKPILDEIFGKIIHHHKSLIIHAYYDIMKKYMESFSMMKYFFWDPMALHKFVVEAIRQDCNCCSYVMRKMPTSFYKQRYHCVRQRIIDYQTTNDDSFIPWLQDSQLAKAKESAMSLRRRYFPSRRGSSIETTIKALAKRFATDRDADDDVSSEDEHEKRILEMEEEAEYRDDYFDEEGSEDEMELEDEERFSDAFPGEGEMGEGLEGEYAEKLVEDSDSWVSYQDFFSNPSSESSEEELQDSESELSDEDIEEIEENEENIQSPVLSDHSVDGDLIKKEINKSQEKINEEEAIDEFQEEEIPHEATESEGKSSSPSLDSETMDFRELLTDISIFSLMSIEEESEIFNPDESEGVLNEDNNEEEEEDEDEDTQEDDPSQIAYLSSDERFYYDFYDFSSEMFDNPHVEYSEEELDESELEKDKSASVAKKEGKRKYPFKIPPNLGSKGRAIALRKMMKIQRIIESQKPVKPLTLLDCQLLTNQLKLLPKSIYLRPLLATAVRKMIAITNIPQQFQIREEDLQDEVERTVIALEPAFYDQLQRPPIEAPNILEANLILPCETLIAFFKDSIFKFKKDFNREMLVLRRDKLKELDLVNFYNNSILEAVVALRDSCRLAEYLLPSVPPSVSVLDSEVPEALIAIKDTEVNALKVLTLAEEERAEIELAKRLENERLYRLDAWKREALQTMMDGVLKLTWKDVLKRDIPVPPFMLQKEAKDFTDEEKEEALAYLEKVKNLKEQCFNYAKMVQQEIKTAAKNSEASQRILDTKIKALAELKCEIITSICSERLKIAHIVKRKAIQSKFLEFIQTLRGWLILIYKIKQRLKRTTKRIKNEVKKLNKKFINLRNSDKKLRDKFLSKFDTNNMKALNLDKILSLYLSRPPNALLSKATVNDLEELASSGLDYDKAPYLQPQYDEYFAHLLLLNSHAVRPTGIDKSTWDHIVSHRKEKIICELKTDACKKDLSRGREVLKHYEHLYSENQCSFITVKNVLRKIQKHMRRLYNSVELQFVYPSGHIEMDPPPTTDFAKKAVLIELSFIDNINYILKNVYVAKRQAGLSLESKIVESGVMEKKHMNLRIRATLVNRETKLIQKFPYSQYLRKYLKIQNKTGEAPVVEDHEIEELPLMKEEGLIAAEDARYSMLKKQAKQIRTNDIKSLRYTLMKQRHDEFIAQMAPPIQEFFSQTSSAESIFNEEITINDIQLKHALVDIAAFTAAPVEEESDRLKERRAWMVRFGLLKDRGDHWSTDDIEEDKVPMKVQRPLYTLNLQELGKEDEPIDEKEKDSCLEFDIESPLDSFETTDMKFTSDVSLATRALINRPFKLDEKLEELRQRALQLKEDQKQRYLRHRKLLQTFEEKMSPSVSQFYANEIYESVDRACRSGDVMVGEPGQLVSHKDALSALDDDDYYFNPSHDVETYRIPKFDINLFDLKKDNVYLKNAHKLVKLYFSKQFRHTMKRPMTKAKINEEMPLPIYISEYTSSDESEDDTRNKKKTIDDINRRAADEILKKLDSESTEDLPSRASVKSLSDYSCHESEQSLHLSDITSSDMEEDIGEEHFENELEKIDDVKDPDVVSFTLSDITDQELSSAIREAQGKKSKDTVAIPVESPEKSQPKNTVHYMQPDNFKRTKSKKNWNKLNFNYLHTWQGSKRDLKDKKYIYDRLQDIASILIDSRQYNPKLSYYEQFKAIRLDSEAAPKIRKDGLYILRHLDSFHSLFFDSSEEDEGEIKPEKEPNPELEYYVDDLNLQLSEDESGDDGSDLCESPDFVDRVIDLVVGKGYKEIEIPRAPSSSTVSSDDMPPKRLVKLPERREPDIKELKLCEEDEVDEEEYHTDQDEHEIALESDTEAKQNEPQDTIEEMHPTVSLLLDALHKKRRLEREAKEAAERDKIVIEPKDIEEFMKAFGEVDDETLAELKAIEQNYESEEKIFSRLVENDEKLKRVAIQMLVPIPPLPSPPYIVKFYEQAWNHVKKMYNLLDKKMKRALLVHGKIHERRVEAIKKMLPELALYEKSNVGVVSLDERIKRFNYVRRIRQIANCISVNKIDLQILEGELELLHLRNYPSFANKQNVARD